MKPIKNTTKGFDVGSKVRVIKGAYHYTKVGSEGTILREDLNHCVIRFYKLTGPNHSNPVFSLSKKDLEAIE